MLKPEEVLARLSTTVGGFRPASDDIFQKDNRYLPKYVKKGVITVDEEDDNHASNQIFCNVPGCERFFQSVFAYQTHYHCRHRYICCECKKSLPTPHLLDLHLSETHDSYFALMSARNPMYSCFIEECPHRSSTAEERKDHCISVHKFPMNFRFDNPIAISKKTSNAPEAMGDEPMGSEQRVPFAKTNSNFSFGHAKSKTFNRKSYAKLLSQSEVDYKNSLEDSKTVSDLLSSLPSET